ncbi:hypothetical protein RHGRI_000141 [Rhododendron griersonianum]|uniref:Uncharacterized protein n=1 Tax=Rhododendron griersonianum TaxID=479676 RepID=A0AAV6LFE7_9ERIC|nr:hypothetical protein RHGRI_000141 [Rhododendron griersonianum]
MTFTLTISKLQVTNLCNMAWLMQTGSALNQLVQFLVPQSLSKHFTPLALIPFDSFLFSIHNLIEAEVSPTR